MADSRVAVGNSIESQMAGHSGNEGRQGTAGDPCCDEHSDRDVDGGEQGEGLSIDSDLSGACLDGSVGFFTDDRGVDNDKRGVGVDPAFDE